MKKNIFLFISFFICTSSLLSMDQLENYIKQAENAENISKEAATKGDKAEELAKKDEALQWYGKAAAVNVPERPPFLAASLSYYDNERELQQKGARKIVIEAMKLRAQKKYDEAIKIYKYAGDRFKTEIMQLEVLKKPQQPELPKEEKKDWIFVTEIPEGRKHQTDYWRIIEDPITKKHILELNKSEKDYVTHETFSQMMQEAQNKHIPFFLVMLDIKAENIQKTFYEGKSAFHFLAESWNHKFAYIDPKTKGLITNITIFVMGDGGKFIKLKENANADYYLDNFLAWAQHDLRIIKTIDILSEKGKAQFFVADLFKEEAQKDINQKQKQKLLQHARQWYEWALKYLPSRSPEYTQAQEEIKKIPKVEILPEKPQEPKQDQKLLVQNLQNLTKKLRQIPAKLI